MAKKHVALYLTSSYSTYPAEVELWTGKPSWSPVTKEFFRTGNIEDVPVSLCQQAVADVLGITLEIGECLRMEVRPQGLVRPKRAKQRQ